MKIYFVARTVGSKPARVTQGVIERKHWVTLKKKLAADGFVVTYWIPVSDTVWDDVAADHKETQDVQEDRSREQRRRSTDRKLAQELSRAKPSSEIKYRKIEDMSDDVIRAMYKRRIWHNVVAIVGVALFLALALIGYLTSSISR